MSERDVFSSKVVLWSVNLLGALVVVLIFMFLVMTAIAQQEVITRIKEQQLSFGYSSALAINQEARSKQAELAALSRELRVLSRKMRSDESAFQQAQTRVENAWQDLQPQLVKARKAAGCDISIPADANINNRQAAVSDFRQCDPGNAAPPPPRVILAARPLADEFEAAVKEYRDKDAARSLTRDNLAAAKEQVVLGALSPEQQKISTSFSDMDILLSGWMLLGGFLVPLPPAMLQILLSFFSGLFGAVLITLVLLVYPKNFIDVTASKETYARVFLGGLIALCVYIVLLGGTAVLGSASGISAAGSNYMAFCGIGILAGMFSDRVAYWLSERADSFFKRQSQQPSRGNGQ